MRGLAGRVPSSREGAGRPAAGWAVKELLDRVPGGRVRPGPPGVVRVRCLGGPFC